MAWLTTSRVSRSLLVFSGLVPLLGVLARPPDPTLLIYTVFVAACLCRGKLAAMADRMRGPAVVSLFVSFILAGSCTEVLAWLNNYLKAAPEPALFHPQLIPDLILGFGFYGGWAAAWWVTMRWFRFRLAEAFVVTGCQGIFLEQLGKVFQAMVHAWAANPVQSALLGLYVFAVHGSVVGLAMVPVRHRFEAPDRSRLWIRFPVAVALMVVFAFAGTWLVAALSLLLGGLPPKRSILANPLW